MSTDSQSSVPGARSPSREPLTATPDPVKDAWPMTSGSSDRSKSVTSEADSVFSASSRPTNETTPEILDTDSKASAVQHWATAQSPRTVVGEELAKRLSAAAAGQQKHTGTSTTHADDSANAVPPTTAVLPTMTSAISTKADSPSATTKPSPKIPVASPAANLKEDVPHKSIIKLKRFFGPEDRDKPVKKYTSKRKVTHNDDDSDPYNLPEDAESDTCPTNQLKPSKKEKKRQAKKLKLTLSSSSPATVDNDLDEEPPTKKEKRQSKKLKLALSSSSPATADKDSDDEPTKNHKLTKEQRRAQKKVKPAPSPTTSTSSASVGNDSDGEYIPKSKKRKSPLPLKKEYDQPALKKPKTKVSPPSPGPSSSSSSPSTSKSTTPASSSASSTTDRPKQHYELRAAEIVRSPLDYDDCVRDDARPGKAARIRRAFRRFRREQGEPVSTEICGARDPPEPETDGKGEKWGPAYQPGGDGGVWVGWVKSKARRIWGGEVNKSASEYAKKR